MNGTIGGYTHALIDSDSGELVGVAKNVSQEDFGVIGDVWRFDRDEDEADFLEHYEVLRLERADQHVRDLVIYALYERARAVA